jgi:hypothetical protein
LQTANGGGASTGLNIEGLGTAANVINCTVVSTGGTSNNGIRKAYAGAATLKNNAIYGWTADFAGNTTSLTASNNATDLSAGSSGLTGTNNVYGITSAAFQNVANGSEDLRIPSGSPLKNVGTSSGAPTVDIVGQARVSSTDIGAWENQTLTNTAGSVLLGTGRRRRRLSRFIGPGGLAR